MLGLRGALLSALLPVFLVLWAPASVAADEQWLMQIQRYLDSAHECPTPGAAETYSHRPATGAIQSNAAFGPAGSVTIVADTHEVSCLQGTRVVQRHGFHQIEVVSCDGDEFYVYEALRGRVPWRMVVSRFSGKMVDAAPLY